MKGHWATDASDSRIADGILTLEQYRRRQAAETAERDRLRAIRDAAYKAALGLTVAEPLPKQLGHIGAHSPRTGLKGTKRLAS